MIPDCPSQHRVLSLGTVIHLTVHNPYNSNHRERELIRITGTRGRRSVPLPPHHADCPFPGSHAPPFSRRQGHSSTAASLGSIQTDNIPLRPFSFANEPVVSDVKCKQYMVHNTWNTMPF